jgi:hypothetical protein
MRPGSTAMVCALPALPLERQCIDDARDQAITP